MADAFQQQLQTGEAATLGFEERFGLADAEWTAREQRKLQRRLHTAKLRYPASLEAVDFTHSRRLNRQQVLTLGTCAWLAERHNLIVTGPCGDRGRAFSLVHSSNGHAAVASLRATSACRDCCTSWPLAAGTAPTRDCSPVWRSSTCSPSTIGMLAPLRDTERRDLTEVIEDRAERASTLIASQLPVTDWHAVIGDPNQADAICDRLLHDAHRIDMKGRSMRRTHDAPAGGRKETT